MLRDNPREFGAPEEWYEENPEDIEATKAFYDFVAGLARAGHRVDSVTLWDEEPASAIATLVVDFSKVSREAFRFFDGVRFEYIEVAAATSKSE